MSEQDDQHDDRALANWLSDHDEPCPVCSYNLRGVRSPACPECSAAITLGVRCPSAIAGPWALGLIAFTLGLGFDSVTGLFLFVPLIATAGEDPVAIALWITMATLAAGSGIGLAWMLRRRQAWMRMATSRQWKLAWTIFFGVGIFHACVGAALFLMMAL